MQGVPHVIRVVVADNKSIRAVLDKIGGTTNAVGDNHWNSEFIASLTTGEVMPARGENGGPLRA
jgi:hypothetical protein